MKFYLYPGQACSSVQVLIIFTLILFSHALILFTNGCVLTVERSCVVSSVPTSLGKILVLLSLSLSLHVFHGMYQMYCYSLHSLLCHILMHSHGSLMDVWMIETSCVVSSVPTSSGKIVAPPPLLSL